jgi:hypothetical protein
MVHELSITGLVAADGLKIVPAIAWYTSHRLPR